MLLTDAVKLIKACPLKDYHIANDILFTNTFFVRAAPRRLRALEKVLKTKWGLQASTYPPKWMWRSCTEMCRSKLLVHSNVLCRLYTCSTGYVSVQEALSKFLPKTVYYSHNWVPMLTDSADPSEAKIGVTAHVVTPVSGLDLPIWTTT